MAIRYIEQDRTFWLDTEHSSYLLAVVDQENFVGHVYYGGKLQYTEGTPAPVYLMRTGEAPFVWSWKENVRTENWRTPEKEAELNPRMPQTGSCLPAEGS